jgi:CrcB protein
MELAFNRRQPADGSCDWKEPSMPVALAIALGGSLGALARYAVSESVERRVVSVFPWDTFVVNVTGCFFAGFVVAALVNGHATPAWLRLGLMVGFLGAYTTFSAFALDLYDLAVGAELIQALANVAASVGFGTVAVALGTALGRGL